MSARIEHVFRELRSRHQTGLVTYVTGGDPDLERSAQILRGLDRAGADVLEVGVPFSDPLADGPVIQQASERALAAGTTLAGVLDLVESVRSYVDAAIVIFSYANPILRMGQAEFAARAAAVGVDGVLVLDLPVEEAGPFREMVVGAGVDPIFLLSPTTIDSRIRQAAEFGRGFLYAISRLGVTGVQDEVAADAQVLVDRVRAMTDLPIALGFGLSRPEHIREVGACADAAVVGSALVDVIAREADSPDLVKTVERYVAWLKGNAAGKEGASLV